MVVSKYKESEATITSAGGSRRPVRCTNGEFWTTFDWLSSSFLTHDCFGFAVLGLVDCYAGMQTCGEYLSRHAMVSVTYRIYMNSGTLATVYLVGSLLL
jgi:hypothetical protein